MGHLACVDLSRLLTIIPSCWESVNLSKSVSPLESVNPFSGLSRWLGYPSPGMLGSVVHYLALRHVTAFLDYYTWTDRVTKNREGPYTTGWIVTLQRSISALKSFINPDYLPEWSRKFKQAVANAKAELQRRSALFRRRDDLWEDDADVPEGGRMVRRPQITFADVKDSGIESVNSFADPFLGRIHEPWN